MACKPEWIVPARLTGPGILPGYQFCIHVINAGSNPPKTSLPIALLSAACVNNSVSWANILPAIYLFCHPVLDAIVIRITLRRIHVLDQQRSLFTWSRWGPILSTPLLETFISAEYARSTDSGQPPRQTVS